MSSSSISLPPECLHVPSPSPLECLLPRFLCLSRASLIDSSQIHWPKVVSSQIQSLPCFSSQTWSRHRECAVHGRSRKRQVREAVTLRRRMTQRSLVDGTAPPSGSPSSMSPRHRWTRMVHWPSSSPPAAASKLAPPSPTAGSRPSFPLTSWL
jgi:hypothetical protein